LIFKPFGRVVPDGITCEGVLRDKKIGEEIVYPRAEINDYRVAGLLIRTDIEADGKATNVRLLGAIPPGAFGENGLRAIRTWQFTVPLGTSPECLKDRDIPISFVLQ
jgi:hypothetical protein